MTEHKRFNCHVKFSAMPNGIMVLDYEKHGDEQTVIEDISREKAHRVMDRLNELNDENEQLKLDNKRLLSDYTDVCNDNIAVVDENEQLKQQIKIFEKFLEANDLDIDWVEFCGVDECAFENPDFSCQECIHLKGDVE